jgi:hypothetical protein
LYCPKDGTPCQPLGNGTERCSTCGFTYEFKRNPVRIITVDCPPQHQRIPKTPIMDTLLAFARGRFNDDEAVARFRSAKAPEWFISEFENFLDRHEVDPARKHSNPFMEPNPK